MSGKARLDRWLRWYPKDWCQRYGDELLALLEDTYEDRPVPFRCRLALARAGTLERLRGSGLERDSDESRQRVRSGSLLVLCAWAVFVMAGAGFAKFAEHWDAVTPKGGRWIPADAFGAVQGAALVGAVTVLAAALVSLATFIRLMRAGGWERAGRPVLRAALVTSATLVMSVGVIAWAHHLGPRQRNGALWPYLGVGGLWALMVTASIATSCAAAVSVVRHLRFPARVLKMQGTMALVATLAMVGIIGGMLVWWVAVATNAPWFFGSGITGSAASPAPPAMVVAGLLMLLGLGAALIGATRVARWLPRVPSD